MNLQKIKISAQENVELKYRNAAGDLITIEVKEKASDKLIKALYKFRQFVVEICELPKTDVEKISIRGLSFSFSDKTGATGVIITALRDLDDTDAPLLLNTPIKFDIGEESKKLLPKKMPEAIDELNVAIEDYLENKNEQLSLFKMAS